MILIALSVTNAVTAGTFANTDSSQVHYPKIPTKSNGLKPPLLCCNNNVLC